jgi:hypothetical protein
MWCNACQMQSETGCRHPLGRQYCPYPVEVTEVEIKRILALTDEEVLDEAAGWDEDIQKTAAECRAILGCAVANTHIQTSDADARAMMVLNCRSLAFRMQCRVERIEERDGKDGAVTGRGVGISYLFAQDIARALEKAAAMLEGDVLP